MSKSRPSIVAIISTKGGAGKSTVAVHLAIAAAMKKRRPLIIDFDKGQLSILLWSKGLRKKSKKPAFLKGDITTLAKDIEDAHGKYDLIIIDVGAGGGQDVQHIATIAEHVIVPVRASTFDMSGTRNTIDLLRNSADNTLPEEHAFKNSLGKAAIVLNCIPLDPSPEWQKEIETALNSCGAGGVRVIGALGNRDAYATSLEHGHGVTEDKDDPQAVNEILDLYKGLTQLENERSVRTNSVRRHS